MTRQAKKGTPKGDSGITSIGTKPSPLQKFLNWFKRYATLLSIAAALAGVMIGVGILLLTTISVRFDDVAVRIGDTQTDVQAAEGRLGKRIDTVSTDVRAVEGRLGKRIDTVSTDVRAVEGRLDRRIDDLKTEIREARQERKSDMNAIRLDIQGMRQDSPSRITSEDPESAE